MVIWISGYWYLVPSPTTYPLPESISIHIIHCPISVLIHIHVIFPSIHPCLHSYPYHILSHPCPSHPYFHLFPITSYFVTFSGITPMSISTAIPHTAMCVCTLWLILKFCYIAFRLPYCHKPSPQSTHAYYRKLANKPWSLWHLCKCAFVIRPPHSPLLCPRPWDPVAPFLMFTGL